MKEAETMKKIIILILVLCCLLCSCSEKDFMPSTSKNFGSEFLETFWQEYHVFDPHLKYVSASRWEVKVDINDRNITHNDNDEFYFSLIDNTSKSQFVAVTEYQYLFAPGGGHSYYPNLYQHIDAPNPMRDYTISQITLFCADYFLESEIDNIRDFYEAHAIAQNYFEYLMKDTQEIASYDRSSYAEYLDSINVSYEEALTIRRNFEMCAPELPKKGIPRQVYYILVSFEENENLKWVSNLYCDGEKIYVDRETYKIRENRADHESFYEYELYYMELEAEFSNEIISALNLNLDDYLPKKPAFTSAIKQETLSLVPIVKG